MHFKRTVAACSATLLLGPATAQAAVPSTIAVIGDTPYGAQQIADFPQDVAAINADPAVSLVMHLGDIKNGSSKCTGEYFSLIRADVDAFEDPLVYTPGDNEWTDCHRANNGGYLPTERLATLRQVFFDTPGTTLGMNPRTVTAQPKYPENIRFVQSGVVFGVFNIPGSNDDQEPWFATRTDTNGHPIPETERERELQRREVANRRAANLRWIEATFIAARVSHAPAVVLALQADMFDPLAAHLNGYKPYIATISKRARQLDKPVLVLNGDSHIFEADHPFAADNVTRLTVNGSDSCPHEYLRLDLDPASPDVFSFDRVALPSSSELCEG